MVFLHMWKFIPSLVSLILMTFPLAAAAQDLGATLAQRGNDRGATACLACHGADGAGNGPAGFPRLAGMDADYLARQIRDFRSGARQNAVMAPIAKALSDEEAAAVAAYYAALPAPAIPAPAAAPEKLALGEALVNLGRWSDTIPACVQCHGPGARGVDAQFPGIAGQHAGYIEAQLRAWKAGQRNNDPNELMKVVARRLSDEDISAVAAYLATLPASR